MHIVDIAHDRLRRDAVLLVVRLPAGPRRRSVSAIAAFIDAVIVSAYMMTRPLTFRAARPERLDRATPADRQEAFLVGVEDAPPASTSGRSRPCAQQVGADEHVERRRARRSRQNLDALERLDVRSAGTRTLTPSSW